MGKAPVLDIRNQFEFRQAIDRMRRSLLAGGVIAFPTDTFYGLGADPFNPRAVEKLFALKQRTTANPILVLIQNTKQLPLFTREVGPLAQEMIDAFWPGPLTLLFPALDSLTPALTAGTGKIGVRLPGSAETRHLLEEVGPLTATSANLSQGPDSLTLEDIPTELADGCDFMIDGGPAVDYRPSTLIDPTPSSPALLREGAITREEIEHRLGRRVF